MTDHAVYLGPKAAAGALGISPKALRLYEQRGLITPVRTEAGWRTYGPEQMARARQIVGLRTLDLNLTQVAEVLNGDAGCLKEALEAHAVRLNSQAERALSNVAQVRKMLEAIRAGNVPAPVDYADLAKTARGPSVCFALPWPWDGEAFSFTDIPTLSFITGPLGSGKTRLAQKIAKHLPGSVFLEMDRTAESPVRTKRIIEAETWIVGEGGTPSLALDALLAALTSPDRPSLVIDLVERGLDQPTQIAFMSFLRRRPAASGHIVLLTRSTAILDLAEVGPDEAVLFCPANYSLPMRIAPIPGAKGYEALESCLATPNVRARTEGVIAMRHNSSERA